MRQKLFIQTSIAVLFLASTTLADQSCHRFYGGQKMDVLKMLGLDKTRESVDRLITEDDASQVLWTILRESKNKVAKPVDSGLKTDHELEDSKWTAFNASLANVASHFHPEHTMLTKNEVWGIYATYKHFKQRKEQLEGNAAFESETSDALKYSIDTLEQTLAKTDFFRKLQEAGFSLVRPAGEKKMQTVSSEWKSRFQVLQLHAQLTRVTLSGQIGFDSMYSDSIRQRLMNGGMRRRLAPEFTELLKEVNTTLGEFVDTFDLKNTDIDRAVAVINLVDALVTRPEFKRYQEMNQASLFPSARANAVLLGEQLTQYDVLSKIIRPYNATIFQAVRKVDKYDAVEMKNIRAEAIQVLSKKRVDVFNVGTDVVGIAQKLESLTKDISADNLVVDAPTKAEFEILKQFVVSVTRQIPKWKALSSFSAFSPAEVVAANKMRSEMERIDKLLSGSNN